VSLETILEEIMELYSALMKEKECFLRKNTKALKCVAFCGFSNYTIYLDHRIDTKVDGSQSREDLGAIVES
jgi:hypothetical protein